jgi:hypothetical protein
LSAIIWSGLQFNQLCPALLELLSNVTAVALRPIGLYAGIGRLKFGTAPTNVGASYDVIECVAIILLVMFKSGKSGGRGPDIGGGGGMGGGPL